jgi:hypothetical protein
MSVKLDEITQMLEALEIKAFPLPDQEGVIAGFETSSYIDSEGENTLKIVILLEEDGEYLKVFSPMMYQLTDSSHRPAVLQTLLNICFVTKMLQFEFDPRDGEVRAIVEFPIEDSTLTAKQLSRCISAIRFLGDEYHAMIMDAIENGKVPDEESFLRADFEMKLARLRRLNGDIGLED